MYDELVVMKKFSENKVYFQIQKQQAPCHY